MKRRRFLQRTSMLSGGLALALPQMTDGEEMTSRSWQTFEIRTQIEVLKPVGATRVWTPIPSVQETPFQKTIRNTLHCETGTANFVSSAGGLKLVRANFAPGAKPALIVLTQVKTRDWRVNLAVSQNLRGPTQSELKAWLQPTRWLPLDGIVKQRAIEITRSAETDLDKARAIYDCIIENTYRNAKTRGCGIGDIRFMLESGDLGGKCADLNALFVGLPRASGLPARDVYGLRLAPSKMGYKSLGVSSEDVTKAQHCRAEVYLRPHGWVPVDPADVRKVILEEPPGHLSLRDEAVEQVRTRLFGSWEMNWLAYNYSQDVVLPGAASAAIHFLMYPQAETGEGRLDSLDPASFQYKITSHRLLA